MRTHVVAFALAILPMTTAVHATAQHSIGGASNARRIIAARLADPGSLQMRNMTVRHAIVDGQTVAVLCGEYNARNKLGGYAGFVNFAYEVSKLRGVVVTNGQHQVDLFSLDGSQDFYHDIDDDISAGLKPEQLSERLGNATEQAIQYLPTCLVR